MIFRHRTRSFFTTATVARVLFALPAFAAEVPDQLPDTDGKPFNYAPAKVFESPFLNADWDSGIVTLSKENRKKVLDFTVKNSPSTTKATTGAK